MILVPIRPTRPKRRISRRVVGQRFSEHNPNLNQFRFEAGRQQTPRDQYTSRSRYRVLYINDYLQIKALLKVGKEMLISPQTTQAALRFSKNAPMPSAASSVSQRAANASIDIATASSVAAPPKSCASFFAAATAPGAQAR